MEDDNDKSIYLDRKEHIDMLEKGNLPHWHQNGKLQFVTFRLGDSLPQEKIIELKSEIESFKRLNPEPWDNKTTKRYKKLISSRKEKLLDAGYGSCILAKENVRKIVSEALKYKDGEDYILVAYVIMPNHVHILMLTGEDKKLNRIIHSVKGYSGKCINNLLGRTGSVWMREYYDHVVRNEDEHKHYIAYIKNNPGHLSPHQYELYIKK